MFLDFRVHELGCKNQCPLPPKKTSVKTLGFTRKVKTSRILIIIMILLFYITTNKLISIRIQDTEQKKSAKNTNKQRCAWIQEHYEANHGPSAAAATLLPPQTPLTPIPGWYPKIMGRHSRRTHSPDTTMSITDNTSKLGRHESMNRYCDNLRDLSTQHI